MPSLKPWPSDAVIIVAAPSAESIVGNMRGPAFKCLCRDCGEELLADSFSRDAALAMPERMGRPVAHICIRCCVTYDRSSIQKLIDHRRPVSQ